MKFYLADEAHGLRRPQHKEVLKRKKLKHLGLIPKLVAWWLPTRIKNNGENITKSVLGDTHQSRGNVLWQSVETACLGRFPSVRL